MQTTRPPEAGRAAVTIRNLFGIVLVIAIDCSLVHYCLGDETFYPYRGWPIWFRMGFVGSIPLASLVLIGGCLILPRRGLGRPFLTGFVLSGSLALLFLLGVALVLPMDWFPPVYRYAQDLWWKLYLRDHYTFGLSRPIYMLVAESFCFTCLFSLPGTLIALAGGLAGRWFSRLRNNPIELGGTLPDASLADP